MVSHGIINNNNRVADFRSFSLMKWSEKCTTDLQKARPSVSRCGNSGSVNEVTDAYSDVCFLLKDSSKSCYYFYEREKNGNL